MSIEEIRYKRHLPHWQLSEATYFVTICTKHRRLLSPSARSIVLEGLKNSPLIALGQATVMEDHLHSIFGLNEHNDAPLPLLKEILGKLKGRLAFEINRAEGRRGQMLWQDESYDRIIRNSTELEMYYLYIKYNSVEAQLASSPGEYPWYFESEEVLRGLMSA